MFYLSFLDLVLNLVLDVLLTFSGFSFALVLDLVLDLVLRFLPIFFFTFVFAFSFVLIVHEIKKLERLKIFKIKLTSQVTFICSKSEMETQGQQNL